MRVATFLLEIGTEELPADFALLALPQLERQVRHDLAAQRLPHGLVEATSTPRRLVVRVADLPPSQEDLAEERKGPPGDQAFVDGQPGQAAIGFAKRCGVDPASLELRDTPKGPFVFARILQPGRPSEDVLAERIPVWITALQGRRFMRWGEGDLRFSRPIRWLVALLDQQVIPLELEGSDPLISSGRISRGHRLSEQSLAIADAGRHSDLLAEAGVLVERQQRADWIRQQVLEAAGAAQAHPDLPEELFEELVDLVESPSLIEGSVEQRFLDLPPEVLSTVMRSHQRYVPLRRLDAVEDPLALSAQASLLPRFLCIGNGLPEAAATVRRGNERVLKARLADAEFFLEADRAVSCEQRRQRLASVTFAEGLGSLLDRSDRLLWLSELLLQHLPLTREHQEAALRAAHLCKHDLVSQMVGEFPELQGVMGAKYALAEGESRDVALAVLEHYLPRGAGDLPPSSDAGAVVALAERLELLLSIYAKGERPSGSSDPYALRRAGNGLLQILWERGWSPDLTMLLQQASAHWAELLPDLRLDAPALAGELVEALRQRMISLLDEEGFDADLVQAVVGDGVPAERLLGDPIDGRKRVALLAQLRGDGQLAPVQAVVQRAARLAVKGDLPADVLSPADVVDPALFSSPSEAGMLQVLQELEPILSLPDGESRYRQLASKLAEGAEALSAFFDGASSVMVMCDDPAVRRNRLNLLAVLRNQAVVLADFSQLSG